MKSYLSKADGAGFLIRVVMEHSNLSSLWMILALKISVDFYIVLFDYMLIKEAAKTIFEQILSILKYSLTMVEV